MDYPHAQSKVILARLVARVFCFNPDSYPGSIHYHPVVDPQGNPHFFVKIRFSVRNDARIFAILHRTRQHLHAWLSRGGTAGPVPVAVPRFVAVTSCVCHRHCVAVTAGCGRALRAEREQGSLSLSHSSDINLVSLSTPPPNCAAATPSRRRRPYLNSHAGLRSIWRPPPPLPSFSPTRSSIPMKRQRGMRCSEKMRIPGMFFSMTR